MKRKTTDLEQKLINDGWCLTIKRYTGKHSEKTHCYEYHKISDISNNGKSYEQIIELDQKRSQIVNYGIANIQINYLDREELDLIRFLFLELRNYVERLTKKREPRTIEPLLNQPTENDWENGNGYNETNDLPPMTFEQMDELCEQLSKENK